MFLQLTETATAAWETHKKVSWEIEFIKSYYDREYSSAHEEILRKANAYADNFIANLLPNRLDEDFEEDLDEQPSLFPITEYSPFPDHCWVDCQMKLEVPLIPEFDISVTNSANSKPLEVPDFDDLESSLTVPDLYSDDDSIIEDW